MLAQHQGLPGFSYCSVSEELGGDRNRTAAPDSLLESGVGTQFSRFPSFLLGVWEPEKLEKPVDKSLQVAVSGITSVQTQRLRDFGKHRKLCFKSSALTLDSSGILHMCSSADFCAVLERGRSGPVILMIIQKKPTLIF